MCDLHVRVFMKLSIPTLALVAAVAACASRPSPVARVGSAEAGVRAARELGAAKVPEAQLHVQMADEELGLAKRLIRDGEHDAAATMLARAQADAELAVALTREAGARAHAADVQANVRAAAEANGAAQPQP